MLLLLVVLLLIAILSCPYWWAAILKCGMLRRLTRLARSSGYRVRKRNPWTILLINWKVWLLYLLI